MKIALDYDGTIADTNKVKSEWVSKNCNIEVQPWKCTRTECVPIIGEEAYTNLGDYVYESEGSAVADQVDGALSALKTLAEFHSLHLVTARPNNRIEHAKKWLLNNDALHFFDGFHTSSNGDSKEFICNEIGATILIDDDARHVIKIESPEITPVLLQENREDTPELPENVKFCTDWEAVLKVIGMMED